MRWETRRLAWAFGLVMALQAGRGGGADAAMVTYTTTFEDIEFGAYAALPAFDEGLGTLREITFTYDITKWQDVEVISTPVTGWITVTIETGIAIIEPQGAEDLLMGILHQITVDVNLASGEDPDLLITMRAVGTREIPVVGSPFTLGGLVVMRFFEIERWVDWNLDPDMRLRLPSGPHSDRTSGTASITYTYTPAVPEPSTLLMGCAGVAVISMAGRRRRTAP